jgi:hypothetical protein
MVKEVNMPKVLNLLIVFIMIMVMACFIVISPVVYCIGIGEPMARAMVEAPWRFTAARPLGDFTGRTKDGKPIYIQTDW